MSAVLQATDMSAGYGGVPVLHGINIEVHEGEVVALLGANGAGKTTTLLALAGVIQSQGAVAFAGAPATGPLHRRARAGLVFLPEERGVLRSLTVRENLELANVDPDQCYLISPELRVLADRPAGQLSGGEQQILALTRAVASNPTVLLADELSFGLAPIVVARMLGLARQLAERGAGVLLVEQFARQALEAADRAYVLRRGEVVLSGSAAELLLDLPAVERTYFGANNDKEILKNDHE